MMLHLLHCRARRKVAYIRRAGALVAIAFLALFGGIDDAHAQQPTPTDWRAALSCPADQQVYDGLIYCTGRDNKNQLVHVLVADLASEGPRFEYVIPKGRSNRNDKVEECRDVNRPTWAGPEKGCYESDTALYPRIKIADAVARAQEVAAQENIRQPLVAIINADYGSPVGNHGPEGLTIVRGNRLDGAANCDDDYNAALRPFLALGKSVDPATGLVPAVISVLETDSSAWPIAAHSAWGGGPWLVREGAVFADAASCQGQKTLSAPESVDNCTGEQKATPSSIAEAYEGGSCRAAPHTAAGLSRDGRWLFLAISTGADYPSVLQDFMANKLHVWNALKFDGGGSSQMWIKDAAPNQIVAAGDGRALSNWMGIFAADGDGIDLPLDAEPSVALQHRILSAGETTSLQIAMNNTGEFTWAPEDGVELREVSSLFRPIIRAGEEGLPLPGPVAPLQSAKWEWQSDPNDGGVALHRFRMTRRGEAFGDEAAVLVVTIPKELEEQRAEIEKRINEMIQEWQATGQQKLEELLDQIVVYLVDLTTTGLEKLLQELCGGLGLAVILPIGFTLWRRRRT